MKDEICTCECHGSEDVMHFMACCDLCGQKYLNDDGTINHSELYHIKNIRDKPKKRKKK